MSNFLTPEQAGKLLEVTGYTIRRWANEGAISYVKTPGGYYKIPRYEIERLMTPIPAKGVAGDDEQQDAPPKALPKPMF